MKAVIDTLLVFRLTEAVASLVTLVVAVLLAWVLYMLSRGSDIPAVLWCGNTITDPLAFSANILLPLGFLLHVVACALACLRIEAGRLLSFSLFILFIAVSVGTLVAGFRFCSTHLEGMSFRSLLWWI